MNNFFSTLFKVNPANIAKVILGAATGVMAAAAFVSFPPAILASSVIIISIGTTLGLHKAHTAEPPAIPVGERK